MSASTDSSPPTTNVKHLKMRASTLTATNIVFPINDAPFRTISHTISGMALVTGSGVVGRVEVSVKEGGSTVDPTLFIYLHVLEIHFLF